VLRRVRCCSRLGSGLRLGARGGGGYTHAARAVGFLSNGREARRWRGRHRLVSALRCCWRNSSLRSRRAGLRGHRRVCSLGSRCRWGLHGSGARTEKDAT
jgi:hypothetical protein